MKKAIVYIDGFNLYYGIRSLNKPYLKWLDVQKLAESFLRGGSQLVQVKFFTAMITGNTEKCNRQKHYLEALKANSTHLTIIKGHYLTTRNKLAYFIALFPVIERPSKSFTLLYHQRIPITI